MKKIAIFVEGQTELLFMSELVTVIFGKHDLVVEAKEIRGHIESKLITLNMANSVNENKYYVLIFDCGGDSSIKSYIIERHGSLKAQAYSYVIGLRDAYHPPEIVDITNVNRLKHGLLHNIPQSGLTVNIILAIMELEAWFIGEENHYKKISPLLTLEDANRISGIDISSASTETIPHPSETLKQIYQLVGMTYRKRKKIALRTVNSLSYENLCLNVKNRNASLSELIIALEGQIN